VVLSTVFFTWGFVPVLNDILVPHLKGIFDLNYTQTILIQFTFFSAYFLISLPASWMLERLGLTTAPSSQACWSSHAVPCCLFLPQAFRVFSGSSAPGRQARRPGPALTRSA
jgi:FHS family L-fucose permease-like MFS transporter